MLRIRIASELVLELGDEVTDEQAHAIASGVTVTWGHTSGDVAGTSTAPHITATARLGTSGGTLADREERTLTGAALIAALTAPARRAEATP